ncbi:MAG: 30S ribosomal protein S7 [Candidatus Methanofastidiosa archaeon]|nr:30S ribosomal protein S7 [Candidatus Methanofastidiosa archaeon]
MEVKDRFFVPDNLKVFGKWDTDIVVEDLGIKSYVNLTPVFIPHTAGRYQKRRFWKNKINIVERLANKMMRSGSAGRKTGGKFLRRHGGYTGKKQATYKTLKLAFEDINKKTKQNPLEVLVKALEYAGPREEVTTLSYGGIKYHLSVDTGSQRRLDMALKNIALGASLKTFKTKKKFHETLAEEIILASKGEMSSFSVNKKEEVERIAKSAR